MAARRTLLLRANGTAELLGPWDETLWSSDSDEDFLEQWAGSMFLKESDVPEVLNYLVDTGELADDAEADACMIEEESFAADDDDDEPGEDEGAADDADH